MVGGGRAQGGQFRNDITTLATMYDLESVDIDGNFVTSLSALESSPKLTFLSARNNPLKVSVCPKAPFLKYCALY